MLPLTFQCVLTQYKHHSQQRNIYKDDNTLFQCIQIGKEKERLSGRKIERNSVRENRLRIKADEVRMKAYLNSINSQVFSFVDFN